MKNIILLCDGMADEPVDELGGKTPMEAANKPYMNSLAKHSELGLVRNVPEGFPPGSDVAILSVLGYSPSLYYSGRSPLEAASIGIKLGASDLAARANLVTLSDEENYADKTMLDYSGGDIQTPDARVLIEAVGAALFPPGETTELYAGVAYRHCLVLRDTDKSADYSATPPHDITGRRIGEYLPRNEMFREIMKKSHEILSRHPLNLKRVQDGLAPANSLWLWGAGMSKPLAPFKEQTGYDGAVISAVDLIKGIGVLTGMTSINVDGATGYIDTNFKGKAKAAAAALKNHDLVFVHIEAPDECSHRGELSNKIKSIELIDSIVMPILLKGLAEYGDFRLLILPDHATPTVKKTHTAVPVPYLLYDSRKGAKPDLSDNEAVVFSERTAAGNVYVENGHELLRLKLI